jgi:hypothetical protein
MSRRKEHYTLNANCPPGEHPRGRGAGERTADLGQLHDIADLDCCVRAEVVRVAVGSAEHAEILQSIGARAFETVGLLDENCAASELLRAAHEMQGLVTHALTVLAGLQFCAGRMHALSALRQAREDALRREI